MRLVLFTLSIGVILVSVGLAAISAASPNWIYFESPQDSPITLRTKYGLFQRCDQSILDKSVWACRKFPKQESDCRRPIGHPLQLAQVGSQQEELPTKPAVLYNYLQPPQTQNHQAQSKQVRALGQHSRRRRDYEYTSFCSLWRIAGYTSQLSIVFGLGSLLCMLVVLGGGKRKRAKAWPLCAGLVGLHAAFQIATMAIVIQTYRTDQRFYMGTTLGYSFGFSLTSWILDVLLCIIMAMTGIYGQWEIPSLEDENKPLLRDSS